MPSLDIRTTTGDDDLAHVADLIAVEFNDLAPNRYLVPDPVERVAVHRAYFLMLAEMAAAGGGTVQRTADGSAAVVWFDATSEPEEPPSDYADRLAELAGPHLPRFEAVEELLVANTPSSPHWHLAFLAVRRDVQGRGIGGELMGSVHARLDAAGIPAYLEATSAENARVYRRHGYVDMDPFALALGGEELFYRMWREPRAA